MGAVGRRPGADPRRASGDRTDRPRLKGRGAPAARPRARGRAQLPWADPVDGSETPGIAPKPGYEAGVSLPSLLDRPL